MALAASSAESRLTVTVSHPNETTLRTIPKASALRGRDRVPGQRTVARPPHEVVDVAIDVLVDGIRATGCQRAADDHRRHQPRAGQAALGEHHGRHGGDQQQLDDARLGQRNVGAKRIHRARRGVARCPGGGAPAPPAALPAAASRRPRTARRQPPGAARRRPPTGATRRSRHPSDDLDDDQHDAPSPPAGAAEARRCARRTDSHVQATRPATTSASTRCATLDELRRGGDSGQPAAAHGREVRVCEPGIVSGHP